jgi:GNAT superfamily N-acetyltransferase
MRVTDSIVHVRQATPADVETVSSILLEAATWLERRGIPLWRHDELALDLVRADVAAGAFWIGDLNGEPAGTVRVSLSDPDFWPEVPDGETLFLHRLAVRRRFAGGQVSTALLAWACDHARGRGLGYVRLDCEASRPQLKAIYERFGFRYHSDQQVGPYLVSRYELDLR